MPNELEKALSKRKIQFQMRQVVVVTWSHFSFHRSGFEAPRCTESMGYQFSGFVSTASMGWDRVQYGQVLSFNIGQAIVTKLPVFVRVKHSHRVTYN